MLRKQKKEKDTIYGENLSINNNAQSAAKPEEGTFNDYNRRK